VLERLRRLLGADEARLATCEEIDRILDEPPIGVSPPRPALPGVSLLLDASLLSARALEIRSCGECPFRLSLEEWLPMADPGLGFFTEPDDPSSRLLQPSSK
jgi:hypothetical protein